MWYHDARRRVYALFDVGAGGRIGWYLDAFIVVLIVANVVAVMLETVDALYAQYEQLFFAFETVSVVVFSAEYLARLWTATERPDVADPVRGRLAHAVSPFMVVDLLAILPFFLGAVVDLRSLRVLRLLRFLRFLKLARYSRTLQLFARAIRLKRAELIVTGIVGGVLLLVASTGMYFAERGAQPDAFSSIPAALWWGVVTLTTVGYGDVHPVTALGRVLGAFVAVLGVGLFALPASILASGFMEAARGRTLHCPHCGRELLREDVEEVLE